MEDEEEAVDIIEYKSRPEMAPVHIMPILISVCSDRSGDSLANGILLGELENLDANLIESLMND